MGVIVSHGRPLFRRRALSLAVLLLLLLLGIYGTTNYNVVTINGYQLI